MINAEVYAKSSKGNYKTIYDVLKDNSHLLQWRPEERVLDAGCGPGDVTAYVLQPMLPQDFRLLLGVDISTSMIAKAQETHAGDRMAFAILDIGTDISKLQENNKYSEGFDKIFSFFVLHWIEDLRKCVSNMYTLLRSGGQALLFFPVDRRFQIIYKQLRSSDRWKQYFKDVERIIPSFPKMDPKSEFEDLASSVGFEVQKCELEPVLSDFESLEEFKGLAESLDPDIICVPRHLKNDYLDECIQMIRDADSLKADGLKVIYIQTTLTCVLRKP